VQVEDRWKYALEAIIEKITWIWKTKCVPRVKFFAWLLLNDRLNTRNILRRRKKFLEERYNCALCQEVVEEMAEHLFFNFSSIVCRRFYQGIFWEENANIHLRCRTRVCSAIFYGNLFDWCLVHLE